MCAEMLERVSATSPRNDDRATAWHALRMLVRYGTRTGGRPVHGAVHADEELCGRC